jgi:hypothetical protein
MPDTIEPLILDLLEWVSTKPRTYRDVLTVWRTSCPRLPVWEEANDRGYLDVMRAGAQSIVSVSQLGLRHLRVHRPHTFLDSSAASGRGG